MQLTFLGTGATRALPLYGCTCHLCTLARVDITRRRMPASALLESGDMRILIDAGRTDLTTLFPAGSIDAFCLTHFHPDHVQGLFHLRWGMGQPIDVHCPPDKEGCADLYKNPGLLKFQQQKKFVPFQIGEMEITPVPLIHSKVSIGYCFEHQQARLAYLCDTTGLPPATLRFLKKWRPHTLILDCTHPPQEEAPKNHNDWLRAMECVDAIRPGRAWLTHISHDLDHWLSSQHALPPYLQIARDMETIDVHPAQAEESMWR